MLRWLTSLAPCAGTRHPRAHSFTPVILVDLVVVGPLPVYLLQPTFRPRMDLVAQDQTATSLRC